MIDTSSTMGIVNTLNNNQKKMNKTFAQLSSGSRITAESDPAGLAIVSRMTASANSLGVNFRNTMDGVSMVQVAEGGAAGTGDSLLRMRELAMQASNGTLSDEDRGFLQTEFSQLSAEIDRTAESTSFNGQKVLDGTLNADLQVGQNAGDTINVQIDAMDSTSLGVDTGSVDLSTQAGAQAALEKIDAAIDQVSESRSDMGAMLSRLDSTSQNIQTEQVNTISARSRINDTDVAEATAENSRNQIQQQFAIALMAQANTAHASTLKLITGK